MIDDTMNALRIRNIWFGYMRISFRMARSLIEYSSKRVYSLSGMLGSLAGSIRTT